MRMIALAAIVVLAFGLAAFMGCNLGTGGASNDTNNGGTGGDGNDGAFPGATQQDLVVPAGRYVGAETCAFCHSRFVGYWGGTTDAEGSVTREPSAHARALDTLLASDHAQDSCLQCHTVGYGQDGGFNKTIEELRAEREAQSAEARQGSTDGSGGNDVEPWMPDLGGVQCENCHGPGRDHALNPSANRMETDGLLSADVCGQCHTGAHHPTYDEWQTSAHAGALETIANSDHGSDSCLACHSVDYIQLNNQISVPEVAAESLASDPTPAQFGLTCQTCHRVHSATLRLPAEELCIECHTMGTAAYGRTPHHAQAESLGGIGAYARDGSDLVGDPPAHSAVDGLCAGCHMFPSEYISEGEPANTGHSWLVRLEGDQNTCAQVCHYMTGHSDPGPLVDRRQAAVQARVDELRAYYTPGDPSYIDPSGLDTASAELYNKAKFNVQFVEADGSGGVHNPRYINNALEAAETIFESL